MGESGRIEDSDVREQGGSIRLSRRRVLAWLSWSSLGAAVAVTIGQILRFLSFEPPTGESSVSPVGPPEAFAADEVTYVAKARVYIGHDSDGLFALDAVCTHLGCLIEPAEMGRYRCPCHGSYFSPDGQALTGPATVPLRFLHLWQGQDGRLMVDRDVQVDAAERLIL